MYPSNSKTLREFADARAQCRLAERHSDRCATIIQEFAIVGLMGVYGTDSGAKTVAK